MLVSYYAVNGLSFFKLVGILFSFLWRQTPAFSSGFGWKHVPIKTKDTCQRPRHTCNWNKRKKSQRQQNFELSLIPAGMDPTSFTLQSSVQPLALSEMYADKTSIQLNRAFPNNSLLNEDDDEDEGSLKLRYVGRISVKRPAFLQLTSHSSIPDSQPQHNLWISQFSLTRTGSVTALNLDERKSNPRIGWADLKTPFEWPNEISLLPPHTIPDLNTEAVLVSDGFLMPGKCDGGVYVVIDPGGKDEQAVQISALSPGWFYHKSVWIDLYKTGRKGLLTARAKKPLIGPTEAELVFFEQPDVLHPLAPYNTPWRETFITNGPDVMFEVLDLDPDDDTIEIIAAEFFSERLSLTSISTNVDKKGETTINCMQKLVLDNKIGPAYGLQAVNLRTGNPEDRPTHILVTSHACQYDLKAEFSVEEITCGEKSAGGGVLYAYEIPITNWRGASTGVFEGWRGWKRHVIASGFRVHGLGINPGAPGFVYTFHPRRSTQGKERPHIAIAGDCAQAAYFLAPKTQPSSQRNECLTEYETLCMISCEGTVGSLAFGYVDISRDQSPDQSETTSQKWQEWVKIFMPSYDQDKVYVFEMTDQKQGRYHLKALKWFEGVKVDIPW